MENKTPKISVIIPVYNVEEYLEKCLESVLEIICINDGSTDSSLDILKEYAKKDSRFVVFEQQNKGLSASRNKGVEISKGEYIAFIDSDDYIINNDYFEKMYNACKKYDADIAVASIIRGREEKNASYLLEIEAEKVTSDYKEKLHICDVPDSNYVWNKLYKKSTLVASGVVFPDGMLYEDLWYTHKILYYLKTLVSVPGVAYFYRKRKNSIVKTMSTKAKKDKNLGVEELYRFLEDHDIDVSEMKTVVKKYKFLGLTVYKTLTHRGSTKKVLFNFIKW